MTVGSRKWKTAACAAVVALGCPSVSFSSEERAISASDAKIEFRLNSGSQPLQGLEFDDGRPALRPGNKTGDTRPFVKLKGSYKREGWIVIVGTEKPETDDRGRFTIELPVDSKMTYVTVTAVNLRGVQESSEYVLDFPDWDLFNGNTRVREGRKNIVTLGGGPTYIAYSEDLTQPVTQFGASAWVAYRRLILPPILDFQASVKAFALPITATDGMRFWTVGFNALAGVVLPWPREPYRLGLLVGYYRVHMFQPDNLFGFTSAAGPQLYPYFQYVRPDGNLISGYVKYSPVSNQAQFLTWSDNHEIAGGLSYSRKTGDGTFVKYSVDYTLFKLKIQGIELSSHAVNLGISYDFMWPK
jgi:hypothetical protein